MTIPLSKNAFYIMWMDTLNQDIFRSGVAIMHLEYSDNLFMFFT